jgi:hypothetical protein
MFGGSPRWLIGLLMIWVLLCVVGNIIEGADALTENQVRMIQNMTAQEYIEAKDPNTGGVVTYGSNPFSIFDTIRKAITMDWTWLYDIDTSMAQADCSGGGMKWNATIPACQVPNDFMLIWAIIYWPITAGILIEGVMSLAKLVRGGG